jgi:hypothetical protein
MSRKVEIVPNEMGGFEVFGKSFEVSAATDVVVRFVDEEYDYLRYLDPEAKAITMHWLGKSALATIAGWGIPETRDRLKMQQCEHDEYVTYKSMVWMGEFEQEVVDIPPPTEGFEE